MEPNLPQGRAAEAFKRFDADGNGALDLQEFTEAFKFALNQVQRHGLISPDLQHGGIGAQLDLVRSDSSGHHHIRITKVVDNGSIHRDGRIHVGDRLTHINGEQVEEWNMNKILDAIIGPCGSLIRLTVLRDASSQGARVDISLERGTPIHWHFMDRIYVFEKIIKEKDEKIERMKFDHESELRERDIRHAAEMEERTQEWREQLAAELKTRDDNFAAAIRDYQVELKKASLLHAEALKARDDASSKHAQEFREQLLQQSMSHAQDLQTMSKEHAAALQRLVQDQDAAQRKLAEDYDARLCECHQQQESALLAQFKDMEKKRIEMEAQLLVRIDNMQQETAKTIQELSKKQQDMLVRAHADMKEQVAKIQANCDLAVQQVREERDAAQAQATELQKGLRTALGNMQDLERTSEALVAENQSLSDDVAKLANQLSNLRTQKSEIIAKYKETELSLQDQIFDAVDQCNIYKAELDAFNALPNPTGVGLVVDITTGLDKDRQMCEVRGVIPGMSAAASGVIAIADRVLLIDGMSVKGRSSEEVKTMLSGRRGSRVSVSFQRPSSGENYTLVLKRGAWGREK